MFRHWRLFVQVSVHVFVDVVLLVALGAVTVFPMVAILVNVSSVVVILVAVTVFSMVMILMAVSSMVMVVGRTLFKRLLLLSLQIYNY